MISHIVLFTHPSFLNSNSMPKFANMILEYLLSKNYSVECWTPESYLYKMSSNKKINKWLGYLDQYLIFPLIVKKRLMKTPKNTLFVFCDQALGPWVPLVRDRPHVIHCHDLQALKSSLDLIPQNKTSRSGKIYQAYIRNGFQQGENFISISKKTKQDLHQFSKASTKSSTVVYNGLNHPFKQQSKAVAFSTIKNAGILNDDTGCLLHVGGGQWYKNTIGILRLYESYCGQTKQVMPLIMVSPIPSNKLAKIIASMPSNARVKFIQGIEVQTLEALYSYADAFLFPSLFEGFGWPIIEAQACGCPVITTDEMPMNEISGPVAILLPKLETNNEAEWLDAGVNAINYLSALEDSHRLLIQNKAITWTTQFSAEKVLDSYLNIYEGISHN